MDDRNLQCPNCGSAVLPSARFCVTCGIRLPEPAAGSGEPARWDQPADDVWIGESPSVAPDDVIAVPPDGAGSSSEDADDTDGRATAGADEPQANASSDLATPLQAEPASEASHTEPATPEGAVEEHPEFDGELVGPEGELAPAAPDGTPDEPLDEALLAGDSSEETAQGLDDGPDADDFEPAGWDDSDEGPGASAQAEAIETGGPAAAMATPSSDRQVVSDAAADQGETLERAETLLDELRSLLPRLAAPAASEPSVDRTALRHQAIATRGERSFDDFASLREVIHDAVHRPKDIEVVLRLSQHAEDIKALLDERDRLQAAFDDLLRGLE